MTWKDSKKQTRWEKGKEPFETLRDFSASLLSFSSQNLFLNRINSCRDREFTAVFRRFSLRISILKWVSQRLSQVLSTHEFKLELILLKSFSPSWGTTQLVWKLAPCTRQKRWRVFFPRISRYALRRSCHKKSDGEEENNCWNELERSLKRKNRNREENKYFARVESRENSQTSCVWLNSRVTLVNKHTSAFEASTSLLRSRLLSSQF